MKILVTGGAGFIGSNLVEALLGRGAEVRVLDNFSTGKRENLEGLVEDAVLGRLEVMEGDLRDPGVVERACQGMEYVFHQGALPSVARSLEDPLESTQVNVVGTLNLLLGAKRARVRRVIYASSSSVYGNSPQLPKREEMRPDPLSPYAVSKLTGEEYCKVVSSVYGLETVSLRYFNVFGPRQDPFSHYSAVIPKFIVMALHGHPLPVFGNGEQSRDFTYIENVIQANLLAMEAEGISGQAFNIGCGGQISLNRLIEHVGRIIQSHPIPLYQPPRQGDVRHSFADVSKAERLLGYEIQVGFDEGLSRTVDFWRTRARSA